MKPEKTKSEALSDDQLDEVVGGKVSDITLAVEQPEPIAPVDPVQPDPQTIR